MVFVYKIIHNFWDFLVFIASSINTKKGIAFRFHRYHQKKYYIRSADDLLLKAHCLPLLRMNITKNPSASASHHRYHNICISDHKKRQ